MAENEAGVAAEEQEFEYPVTIEEAGPAARKVSVEIPRERIEEKLQEQFKDIRQQAVVPGFRKGHAPQRLVEKKFASDVRDEVRRTLLSESYQQVIEKNNLQVLGDPQFDEELDKLKLPEDGPLKYSFEVEVQPEIPLPELKGIPVRKPRREVTEEDVDQAVKNLQEQQGTLVPVEDRAVESGDYLTADVHVKAGGEVIVHQHDAQLVARPARVAGIQMDDLDKQLAGMKGGETKVIAAKAPDSHSDERLRGKDIEIEVALKDIKRLEPAELDQEFLEGIGFSSEQELRDALREQMRERLNTDIQRAMREQVRQHLLVNTQFELPEKLSDRQTERVVQRRMVDLMMRGVPRDEVIANAERLRTGARDEAIRELKLFFILQKVATELGVDVSEAELNGQIHMIAVQQDRRPEKLKQEMASDGTLLNLFVQMREQKAIDRLLEQARIEEVEPEKK